MGAVASKSAAAAVATIALALYWMFIDGLAFVRGFFSHPALVPVEQLLEGVPITAHVCGEQLRVGAQRRGWFPHAFEDSHRRRLIRSQGGFGHEFLRVFRDAPNPKDCWELTQDAALRVISATSVRLSLNAAPSVEITHDRAHIVIRRDNLNPHLWL